MARNPMALPADSGNFEKKKVVDVPKAEAVYDTQTVTVANPNYNSNSGADEYRALLAEIKAQNDAQVKAAYDRSKSQLDSARESALKDAYTTYMHGLKNVPQISAVSGNGGQAQSLITKQQLGYENNRAATEQGYMDNLRELEAAKADGLVMANQDYLTQLAALAKTNMDRTAAVPATTTTTNKVLSGYKVGGDVLSKEEYLQMLRNAGMNATQAAAYMKANGIPY